MTAPSPTGSGCAGLSDSSQPVIAVTTYRQQAVMGVWDVEAAFLPAGYFASVTGTGAGAVLLPPQPPLAGFIARVLDSVDGLVMAGGRDVNPERYGQTPGEFTDKPDTVRDEWEFALLEAALERNLPVLAICRGMQVLNTLKGGTLHQHVPDVVGDDSYQLGGGKFTEKTMTVTPGSALASALGGADSVVGHVYHHQAVDRVGAGLTVSARSDDGIIEALDIDGAAFGVAVQWHPEVTSTQDSRLFESLTAAAQKYRSN